MNDACLKLKSIGLLCYTVLYILYKEIFYNTVLWGRHVQAQSNKIPYTGKMLSFANQLPRDPPFIRKDFLQANPFVKFNAKICFLLI